MGKSWLRLALESAPLDGKVRKEHERVYYGEMANPEELKKASKALHQEQWGLKIDQSTANVAGGQLRLRKEWEHGRDPQYIFTTKVKDDEGQNDEHEIESTEDHFNLYKKLADQGMVKTRYCFPVAGSDLVWEVDAFTMPDGSTSPWVKMDLELPEGQENIETPAFPISLKDVFSGEDTKMDLGRDRQLKELYQTYFLRENEHVAAARIKTMDELDEQVNQIDAGATA